jgi:ParB-like chromosome segregation protein Spo0J
MNLCKPLVAQTTLVALKDIQSNRLKDSYKEHPDDLKYQEVEKAILKEGLLNPIKVKKSDMVVVTGNQRCWFAKKYGYTHISVEYVE